MNLIIDEGNSFSKIAVYEFDNITYFKIADTKNICTIIEKLLKTRKIQKAIYSSVIKNNERAISILNNNLDTIIFNFSVPVPIKINYLTPQTLGLDRLAGVIGANNLFPKQNILVIDAGTCIKYDFINNNSEYQGGSISPGLQIRFKSLNTFTEKLPLIKSDFEIDYIIGNNTMNSLLSGVINGISFEINGFINYYKDLYENLKIFCTGGDMIYFDKRIKNSIFANPNLILWGLNVILNYNAEKNNI
ncbi:MAG: hypothetical protein A2X12_07835 [Bacteroidetes bacterium GWE2_29_8]|nr:MAG: hypothetical protein A2X12_07835 [Bacteroidetes bacterium GWE2_29_8]OFY25322.1 MAG: hypothetical protein A2X02_09955 [Bacteroidetes bacterium GWF2_29_10]